jgi:hypothetical protein
MKRWVQITIASIILLICLIIGTQIGRQVLYGHFSEWEYVGSPPGEAVKFLGGQFFIGRPVIFVETAEGYIYMVDYYNHTGWRRITKHRVRQLEEPDFLVSNTPNVKPLEGVVDELVFHQNEDLDSSQYNFVILDDGSVRVWGYSTKERDPAALQLGWGFLCFQIGGILILSLHQAFLDTKDPTDWDLTKRVMGTAFILLLLFPIVVAGFQLFYPILTEETLAALSAQLGPIFQQL